jgi:hypothetical protein
MTENIVNCFFTSENRIINKIAFLVSGYIVEQLGVMLLLINDEDV